MPTHNRQSRQEEKYALVIRYQGCARENRKKKKKKKETDIGVGIRRDTRYNACPRGKTQLSTPRVYRGDAEYEYMELDTLRGERGVLS